MPDLFLELAHGGVVIGVDEVGRGPLAGPVVASAAWIDPKRIDPTLLAALDDSKKLSRKAREALAPALLADPGVRVRVAEASVAEIDSHNILRATFLAMARAVDALSKSLPGGPLGSPIALALVDGNRPPPLPCPVRCLIKGDGLSSSIAAASIVAKVDRDATMATLAEAHPGYGWDRNAGYGTAEHREALTRLGATAHHRRSFAPVRLALDRGSESPPDRVN
ncbi:MAG: ribonuclease HII [Rhodospirillum sp.]|nr:ribonuclease HII [Rhodospirillum sp.]MCF8488903.1 ribonuclease HII [Rhodospirillum sp.]MCF8500035.1 ribonuclease HII [Rhodospirillum sp.]